MNSPILALRAAIRSFLVLDTTLSVLLGCQLIYSEAPSTAETPSCDLGWSCGRGWTGRAVRSGRRTWRWSRCGPREAAACGPGTEKTGLWGRTGASAEKASGSGAGMGARGGVGALK